MPYAGELAARLYYDDSCGPCRLLARASAGLSRHRLIATPLAAPAADDALGALPPEVRHAYAHLVTADGLLTGEMLAVPLLGVALGPRIESAVRRLPPVVRAVKGLYVRLWEYRRTRGCASRAGS
jgi:hypothetical protein